MKKLFILILYLIIGCKPFVQSESIRGHKFKLIGSISEEVQMTAGCGVIAFGTVIVFSVNELTGMSYPNKNIGIVITCPNDYEKNFFEKGKTYKVVFSDKNQAKFDWLIPNKDLLVKNGLSFCPYAVQIIKIP